MEVCNFLLCSKQKIAKMNLPAYPSQPQCNSGSAKWLHMISESLSTVKPLSLSQYAVKMRKHCDHEKNFDRFIGFQPPDYEKVIDLNTTLRRISNGGNLTLRLLT